MAFGRSILAFLGWLLNFLREFELINLLVFITLSTWAIQCRYLIQATIETRKLIKTVNLCWFTLMYASTEKHTDNAFFDIREDTWNIGLGLMVSRSFLSFLWIAPWTFIFTKTVQWRLSSFAWMPQSVKARLARRPRTLSRAPRRIKCVGTTQESRFSDKNMKFPVLVQASSSLQSCKVCDKGDCRERATPRGDREHHSSDLGMCFPLYDHYCKYLASAVYLTTIKPYVHVLFFLTLDFLLSIGILIYGLTVAATTGDAQLPFAIVLVVILTLFAVFAFSMLSFHGWRRLCLWNWTFCEDLLTENHEFVLAYRVSHRGEDYYWLKPFGANPWHLGVRENIRQALGSGWRALFFWIAPERVIKYGKYGGGAFDYPFSDSVHEQHKALLERKIEDPNRPVTNRQHPLGQGRRRGVRSSGTSS